MKLRSNLQVTIDPKWEQYNLLSNRQIIRKSPACRVNITMFAAPKPVPMPAQPNRDEVETPEPEDQHLPQLPETTEGTDGMPGVSDPVLENAKESETPQNQSIESPKDNMPPATAFEGTLPGTDVTSME